MSFIVKSSILKKLRAVNADEPNGFVNFIFLSTSN